MKKLLFLLVLCLSSTAFSQVPSYVPSNGLIGYWPFNGNANDESGNGNDGTVNGATLTTDRFGNANAAYDFDGQDDEVRIPHNSDFNLLNDMTISVWFRSVNIPSANNNHTLIAKRDDGGSCCSPFVPWQLSINYSNPTDYKKIMMASASSSYSFGISSTDVVTDVWEHAIATIQGDSVYFYLNGVFTDVQFFPLTARSSNTSDILIGAINRAVGDEYMEGSLDDIGIWNRALTQQEVSDLYTTASSPCTVSLDLGADTVIFCDTLTTLDAGSGYGSYLWSTGETTQTIDMDSSGMYSVTVGDSAGVANNHSLSFDGVDDLIDFGDTYNNLSLPVSFAFDVKMRNSSSYNILCTESDMPPSNNNYFGFWIEVGPSAISASYGDGGFAGGARRTGRAYPNLSLHQWYNIIITINGPGDFQFYVNGQALSMSYIDPGSGGSLSSTNFSFTVGGVNVGNNQDEFYNGIIDNLQIWDKVLSYSEIQQYSLCPPTGSESDLTGYWNFEEGTGSVVNDLSGNGNNGTINGATWSTDVPQTCIGCTATDSVYVDLFQAEIAQEDSTICFGDSVTLSAPMLIGQSYSGVNTQSLAFNQGQYAVIPNDGSLLNAREYTIEFWYKETGSAYDEHIFGNDWFGSKIYFSRGNGVHFLRGNDLVVPWNYANQWTHYAGVRDNDSVYFFINGILMDSDSYDSTTQTTSDNFSINHHTWSSGQSARLSGFFDELRISDIARYSSSFTPPFYEFQSDANTLYLMHFNGDMTDELGNNGSLSGAGWSNDIPFSAYSQSVQQYSYAWSTGDTTASINVSPSQTTTYSVTVSNGISSCIDSVTVSVSSPSVDLGADTISFCDTVTTLDAGSGYGSYLWSTGETTQTIDVDSSGMYSVTVGDGISSSLSFDGIDDGVFGSASGLDVTNNNLLSINAWINPNLNTQESQRIFSLSDNSVYQQYALVLNDSGRLYFLSGTSSFESNGTNVGSVIPLNTWTHVTVTYDGSAVRMYVNGFLDFENIVSDVFPNGYNNISIWGQRADGAERFNGNIDDVSVWNRALTQSEIQQYMNCPPTGNELGLVGYWDFDEGTGSVVNDLSGNGNNGTINGASWSTGVPNQTCVGCTATDSVYVNLLQAEIAQEDTTICFGDSVTLNSNVIGSSGDISSRFYYGDTTVDLPSSVFNQDPNWTIATRFRVLDLANEQMIYHQIVGGECALYYYNQNIIFQVNPSNSGWVRLYAPMSDTDWHTVSASYDRNIGIVKLALDGVVIDQSSVNGVPLNDVNLYPARFLYSSNQAYTTYIEEIAFYKNTWDDLEHTNYRGCLTLEDVNSSYHTYYNFNEGSGNVLTDYGISNMDLNHNGSYFIYSCEDLSYLWSTGDTTASIDVSPSQTTTYSVTVSNGISSCTDSVTVSVSSPSVDLGADTISLCDTITTLDAGSGYGSYLWSTGETTQTIDVDSSGVYSVTVGDNSGVTNNHSLSFDGVNDNVNCGSTLQLSTALSLGTWFKTSVSSGQRMISNSDHCSNNRYFLMIGDASLGDGKTLKFNIDYDGPSTVRNGGEIGVDYSVSDGSWHYAVGTWDGNHMKLYLDGLLVASTSGITGPINYPTIQYNTYIGNDFCNVEPFDGQLEMPMIWNRALTQSEIHQYMNCPPTGNEAGLVGYWNFEEGTGSVVNDLSGNGNNGTINGASWSTDVPNQACGGCTASDSVYVDLFQAEITQEDTTICFGDSLSLSINGAVNDTSSITELWHNQYSSDYGAFGRGMMHDRSVVISGAHWPSWPSGKTDQMISKIDSNGGLTWQHVRSPGGDHDSYNAVEMYNNNYLFFGQQNAQGTLYFDGFWTVFDQNGNELSAGNIAMPGSSSGTDMKLLPNGNIVFTGPDASANAYVRLTDNSFNAINNQTINGGFWPHQPQSILEFTPDSSNIFAISSDANSPNLPLIKYDLTLNQVSDYTANMGDNQLIYDVEAIDDFLYLVGYKTNNNVNYGVIYKYNFSGVLLESFVDSMPSSYTAITELDGNILIAKSNLSGSSSTSNEIVRYLGNGELTALYTLNNGLPFVPYDLITDQDYIYVIGAEGVNHWIGIPAVSKLRFNSNSTLSSNISWSTGDTTASIDVSPSQTTTYSVTVSNGISSCTDSVTVTVAPVIQTDVFEIACDNYTWLVNGLTYSSSGLYSDTLTTPSGCDSIVTLNLTINNSTSSQESITACDSYSWNGVTYQQSGIYSYQTQNADGCDSTATLNLTINQTTFSTDVKVICDSYTWIDGQTYTASTNTPMYTYVGFNGCDSIVRLDLTILRSTSDSVSVTACDSFTWNGTTYYQSGGYTYQTQNADGCDSTATLSLRLNNSTSSTTAVTACNDYTWNGVTYQQSGTYTYQTQNADGCDSIATLVLTINNSTSSQESVTACNSYQWNGGVYTQSGNYTYQTQNAAGCDSTVFLNLTINYSTSSQESVTACNSYQWNGGVYTQSGIYTYQTQNADGCDSIATLVLTINTATSSQESVTACNSYQWNGGVYTQSGNYTYQTQNAAGCDSIATLVLTINTATSSQESITACDSYSWNGGIYTQSGIYTYQTQNADGCDSIATLVLTIDYSTSSQESITACDSYQWNGGVYTQSGNYTYQTQNADGCDSTVFLNLTINYSTSSQESVTACNSYQWNGGVYTQSGNYTYQTQNANGCDSTVFLNLTINNSTSSQESVTACDSYQWNGGVYTQSGNYTYQTQNADGCDSTVFLNLTINYSTSSQESVTACNSYQWNGGVYTQSGNYTYQTQNAAGCDSTVFLNLTINYSTSSQESVTACDNYQWNGVTYQQSGTYTYQTQNANGCDSTATLNLTINLSNSGVEVASACESYTWIDGITYLSDTFGPTITLTNTEGCDSVVTLDLTILNTSSSIDTVTYCGVYTWADSVQYSTDTFGPAVTYTNSVGCDSIVTLFLTIEPLNTNIVVTQAFTLTAQQDNGTYQWIDCNNHNAPIPEETNQSYSPVETGLYAVIITANGCTDTSACVSQQGSGVGILESTLPSEVYLYPNPFADELHLELGQYYGSIRLVMYDMIGQTIYSQQYNGVDRIDPTMDVAAGTYTLRLEDDQGRYAMFRIVRKR